MKKLRMLIIMLTTAVFISACGKTDPVAQRVMDEIASIGEVDMQDEEVIDEVMKTYETLTDKQKEQVSNYVDLLEAKDTIEELKNSEKEKYLNIEREFYPNIEKAIHELELSCIFPESLEIKEVIYKQGAVSFVYISYEAKNQIGSMSSGHYSYNIDTDYGLSTDNYSKVRQMATGEYLLDFPYKIADNFQSDSEEINEDSSFVFIVDLDDYYNI